MENLSKTGVSPSPPGLELAESRRWDVIGLWLTHGHFDHLADHAVVKQRFPAAKVLIHELDEPLLNGPRAAESSHSTGQKADGHVSDGQQLFIGSIAVTAIHTPGHSRGHVMYYLPGEKLLVGGDLIIMGTVGCTDLPGCDFDQLQESIRKIMALPPETPPFPIFFLPSQARP